LVSLIVDKVFEKDIYDNLQLEERQPKQSKEGDYFSDRLLKFKLLKVKNKFAPTYKMNENEGYELRQKIKLEAANEMDLLINNTLKNKTKSRLD
jgi:hypothetical protein